MEWLIYVASIFVALTIVVIILGILAVSPDGVAGLLVVMVIAATVLTFMYSLFIAEPVDYDYYYEDQEMYEPRR